MIGSKRKVISVYKALEKEGYAPRKFERVHAPVGLEIGALTPEEIAVSIAAELIAVRRNARRICRTKSVKLVRSRRLATRLTPTCSPPQFSPLANPAAWELRKRFFPIRGHTFSNI